MVPTDLASRLPALDCPFCGPRPLGEFVFRKTLPNVAGEAFARIYLRHDSATESVEEWQHLGGCRGWLRVRRNPSTGMILEVVLA
jgi:sarcosine oxidase subunit delta